MRRFGQHRTPARDLARLLVRHRRWFTIVLAPAAALAVVSLAAGAAGELDPTFGSGGEVLTEIGGTGNVDVALDVAIQRDGKLVASGYTTGGGFGFALARYNPDGSLDTSFGDGGKVVTATSGGAGWAVALQQDGKIVVAGETLENGGDEFALARYNTDGSLDTSFGTGGRVVTNVGGLASVAFDVAIQRNGKIVAAGFALVSGGPPPTTEHADFALVRYNPDGTLDTGFGDGGEVTTEIGDGGSVAEALAIQWNGKIVVAGTSTGSSDSDFALARFTDHGSLDTSFGTNGEVTTDISGSQSFDVAKALALQRNGRIVVAGSSNAGSGDDFALARYTNRGRLDTSFGTDGKVTSDVSGSSRDDAAEAVAIQRNGKIVAAGSAWSGPNDPFSGAEDSAVARFNADGRLDASFGSVGKVVTDVGGTGSDDDVAAAVAIQRDQKLVTAGFALGEFFGDFALVRYLGS
jgi:uncharacterized delta-60 repeat protein